RSAQHHGADVERAADDHIGRVVVPLAVGDIVVAEFPHALVEVGAPLLAVPVVEPLTVAGLDDPPVLPVQPAVTGDGLHGIPDEGVLVGPAFPHVERPPAARTPKTTQRRRRHTYIPD